MNSKTEFPDDGIAFIAQILAVVDVLPAVTSKKTSYSGSHIGAGSMSLRKGQGIGHLSVENARSSVNNLLPALTKKVICDGEGINPSLGVLVHLIQKPSLP